MDVTGSAPDQVCGGNKSDPGGARGGRRPSPGAACSPGCAGCHPAPQTALGHGAHSTASHPGRGARGSAPGPVRIHGQRCVPLPATGGRQRVTTKPLVFSGPDGARPLDGHCWAPAPGQSAWRAAAEPRAGGAGARGLRTLVRDVPHRRASAGGQGDPHRPSRGGRPACCAPAVTGSPPAARPPSGAVCGRAGLDGGDEPRHAGPLPQDGLHRHCLAHQYK